MIGININCKKYPFIDWMKTGAKTIETRNRPTLRKFVGQTVAVIETGKGKARIKGYLFIEEEIKYKSAYDFYADSRHCISIPMKEYEFKNIKYGYKIKWISSADYLAPDYKGSYIYRIL